MKYFKKKSRGGCSEDGIALILVLLVVTALSVIILNLNYTTRINVHLSNNFRDEIKAAFLARGAVEAAIYWLKEDESDYDARCEPGDPSCENEWSLDNPGMEVGDGFVELKIRDEDGKVFINDTRNLFKNPPAGSLPDVLLKLNEQLNLDSQEALDSIQDWIDTNDDIFSEGAEEDYYASLDPPYDIRNGPLLDISELLLVKGIDAPLYYGKSDEHPVGLKDIFTVYSGGKINVNTAPAEVLNALGDTINADDIIAFRESTPFMTKSDFDREFGGQVSKNAKTLYDVKSVYFSAYVKVQVHDISKFVHAVLKRERKSGSVNISIEYWREE